MRLKLTTLSKADRCCNERHTEHQYRDYRQNEAHEKQHDINSREKTDINQVPDVNFIAHNIFVY